MGRWPNSIISYWKPPKVPFTLAQWVSSSQSTMYCRQPSEGNLRLLGQLRLGWGRETSQRATTAVGVKNHQRLTSVAPYPCLTLPLSFLFPAIFQVLLSCVCWHLELRHWLAQPLIGHPLTGQSRHKAFTPSANGSSCYSFFLLLFSFWLQSTIW